MDTNGHKSKKEDECGERGEAAEDKGIVKIGSTGPFTGFGAPPKGGDAVKFKLARRLRQETTMALNWIAKQLNMEMAGLLANLLRKTKGNGKYAIMRNPFTVHPPSHEYERRGPSQFA